MVKDIIKEFKVVAEICIDQEDIFGAKKIFPPLAKYNQEELLLAYKDEDNRPLIEEAKQIFLTYASRHYAVRGERGTFLFSYQDLESFINNNDNDYILRKNIKTKYYYLLLTAFVLYFNERKTILKKYHRYDEIKESNSSNTFYRGQTNSEWRITPSVLRGLEKNIIFDDNYYFMLLDKHGLEDKYNELIRTSGPNKYSKYAYMQHSCSCSPFIDFTRKNEIAASFALSNPGNLNDFNNNDSAIYSLYIQNSLEHTINDEQEARSFLRKTFRLDIINSSYFILGHNYSLVDSNGKVKNIVITSIKKLLQELTPNFKIFDIPTNDRMKYQKGLFVCFYNCICLKDSVFYELNKDIVLTKSIIKVSDKRTILDSIYKERKYDQYHLLNPYVYFTE